MEFTDTDIRKHKQNQQYGTDFINKIKIEMVKSQEREMEFEIQGIDASIANALRRIIISEIPTMAIEKVDMYMNTSVIPDEILAHRLGLIPILADPRQFLPKQTDEDYSENNTLKFKLHVICKRKAAYKLSKQEELDKLDPEQYLDNCSILASQLEWIPIGNQSAKFTSQEVSPIHPNILIAKLRENQEIELEVFCEKNIGKVHAKWQAVSPAFYRLMPDVKILSPPSSVEDQQALVDKCPMNVFEIGKKGRKQEVVVKRPRDCTMCRECIREEVAQENKSVYLGKAEDHYIFTIEAVGMLSPKDIFLQAIEIFRNKLDSYLTNFSDNVFI